MKNSSSQTVSRPVSPSGRSRLLLTSREERELACFLGVDLKERRARLRYERLRDQKIRERRELLLSEDWKGRCFSKQEEFSRKRSTVERESY